MKYHPVLPILLSVVLVAGTGTAFVGGEAYQNRANDYWMQIYATIALVIGVIATGSILPYKILKGKLHIYKKTTDMRKTK